MMADHRLQRTLHVYVWTSCCGDHRLHIRCAFSVPILIQSVDRPPDHLNVIAENGTMKWHNASVPWDISVPTVPKKISIDWQMKPDFMLQSVHRGTHY